VKQFSALLSLQQSARCSRGVVETILNASVKGALSFRPCHLSDDRTPTAPNQFTDDLICWSLGFAHGLANPANNSSLGDLIMAFNNNAARAEQPQNDSWKAQGFLNLYLPGLNGQRKKLGAIPLKESKASEKKLLAWLNEDPSRVAQILSKLEMEYQSATPADAAGFDLN
jgi:hypothetical protein